MSAIRNFQQWLGCFILVGVLLFGVNTVQAGPGVKKQGESLIASEAFSEKISGYYLNGLSFQQDALVTFNNWQYAAYYTPSTGSARNVTLARRQLPNGTWQAFQFEDYTQTTDDAHNTISMGICAEDGTIHLAFDHHDVPLNYRKSVAGLAIDPDSFSWDVSNFGDIQHHLGGSTITPVTYPRFIRVPDGRLQFSYRIGASGDGDEYLAEYDGSTGLWTMLGKYIEGGTGNGYLHGLNYGPNDILHATWCWRETPDASTNHDLAYMYSEDYGRTWRNNLGWQIGTTGSNTTASQDSSGINVWIIPQNSQLINQESQTVDDQGRVHALLREDMSGSLRHVHYYRDTFGIWHRNVLPITPVVWSWRAKITADADGNVYGILPALMIASASVSNDYSDWAIVENADSGRFYSEPQYDRYRLEEDGILSLLYQEDNSSNLYALQYELNAQVDATTVMVNDNTIGTDNNQFEYVGSWSYGRQSGAYDSDNHWEGDTNGYYQVRFYGIQVKVYAAIAPNHGIAAVSIDGGTETNIDFYASNRQEQALVYASPTIASGQHTLKIRVTGTRNSNSSGNVIPADRVDIISNVE
jgi:hypothetical protein